MMERGCLFYYRQKPTYKVYIAISRLCGIIKQPAMNIYSMRFAKNVNKKDCCTRKNPSVAASLPLFPLHYFIPLQSECFRDGNIATTQARNGENMGSQGFVPATRAGKNPFVRTGKECSIFICFPDEDLSIPNSFLTTADLIVKRCAKRNEFAERGSYY